LATRNVSLAMGNDHYDTSKNSLAINVDMAIDVNSTVKSDPKELDKDSQGANSLSNLIASARNALFKSTSGTGDKQMVTTTQSCKWVPTRKTREAQDDSRASGSACKAASFAEGTNLTREMLLTSPVLASVDTWILHKSNSI
jgi:hypothetical protein